MEEAQWSSLGLGLTPMARRCVICGQGVRHIRKYQLLWGPCKWCWEQFLEEGYSVPKISECARHIKQ